MIFENKNLFKLVPLGVLGFIGIGLILLFTCRYGAGISPDSVAYISVARNVAEGHGFITYDGYYFVLQPPLYPLLLASIKNILFVDPLVSAGYCNAVLFGLIVFLSGLFLLKHLKSLTMVILGTLSILISYALVQTSLMALSEPLFILLVLLFLHYFERYQSKRDITSLIIFSVSAALACLTRYTGIIIILTGVISIFLWVINPKKEKLLHLLIFVVIAVLPISIWIVRNYFLSGTLVGQRAVSSFTLFENLKYFFNTILPWYLPANIIGSYLFIILLIILIWILFRLYRIKALSKVGINIIGPSLLFVLFYSGILIISSTTTAYDHISDRLLSPIYVPTVFIIFFITDKILSWLKTHYHVKLVMILSVVGIILLLRYPLSNTLFIIDEYIERSGCEYSSKSWRGSATIQYLIRQKKLGKEYTFYSNAPEAVYILANIDARWSPAKTMYNSPLRLNVNSNQMNVWQHEEKVCLVWFDKINREFLLTIDELQKNRYMFEIAQLEDGEIYTFSAN